MGRTSLTEVAKALGLNEKTKSSDAHVYGEVKSINDDKTYQIALNGSGTTVRCARLAGAKVGDTVMVTLLSNGYAVVTGTVGGDTDASDAQRAADAAVESAGTAQTAAQTALQRAADAEEAAQDAAQSASTAASAASAAQESAASAASSAAAAATSADNAEADAARAATAASAAETKADAATASASEAKQQATEATTAANGAVTALGTVQQVVDTLETDMDDLQTHIAMMDAVVDGSGKVLIPAGLHVVPTSSGYFIVVSNDGMYVYDDQSVLVASFGESISFSSIRPQRIGGEDAYIEYYDSNQDGKADSIRIVGASMTMSSGKTVEQAVSAAQSSADAAAASAAKVDNLENRMNSGEFKGEDGVVLRIDSSRGTVFKNSSVNTVLSVAVYIGGQRITNITDLRDTFGASAHLQWYWQRLGDDSFFIIVDSDHKLSNDGFALTLTPEEVDTKVTFMCELITD